MEEEQPPPASVYPTGKVEVRGEDRSEEAQEGEGGVGCCRGRSRRIGGESETLDSIREAAEENPSNYVLLFIGGKVGENKNRGGGGSADGSGGGGRAIADQRNNLMRLMMHRKLTMSGTELTVEKAASKNGSGRGSSPGQTTKKVGLAKSRLLGGLTGREADDEDDNIMGNLACRERKGRPNKARKGLAFTLRAQT